MREQNKTATVADCLASIKADLEAINNDMSFGVSYSQTKRNDTARDLCSKVSTSILDYSNKLIGCSHQQWRCDAWDHVFWSP